MEQLSALFELATAFHSCRDRESVTRTLANQLARSLNSAAVHVWMARDASLAGVNGDLELSCRARWAEPGAGFDPAPGGVREGLLVGMCQGERATRLGEDELLPDTLVHLAEHDRERVRSALYAPIPGAAGVAGVVEVLNHKSGKFGGDETALIEEAARLTSRVLANLKSFDEERSDTLGTIERLSALYDISRIFNSTIELDDLLPIVADRIRNVIGAQACNLWLVDSEAEELYVAQQAGEDPTTDEDERIPFGEGPVGRTAKLGEARLVADATGDEELSERVTDDESFRVETWMCAPLVKEESAIGAIELVNRADGGLFTEDDLFFLRSVSEQATIALNNANLLEAERKVHELGALLTISKEITSTLDLDHVLTTVVNQAANVIPFERCAIALWDRRRFLLGAVSGEAEVPRTREMDRLREVLEWVAGQPEPVSADSYEEGWETSPEEAKSRVVPYLEEHEYAGFYALPLHDDQGAVGVLAVMSSEAEFLTESHLELLSILASQTTVAIRNARLYTELPLVNFWQPLVEKKKKLQSMAAGRWLEVGWKVAAVVLALVLVPWKMRVSTNATVVPAERRTVSAEVAGVVRQVLVREGDRVQAGAVLAQVDDGENRVLLSTATANLQAARRQMADAESRRDLALAGQARLRMELHQSEVDLYQALVEKARLRAPIAGVVVTPKVEERAGVRLEPGSLFCELVDQREMAVEMNVPETQVALLRPETAVALKLNAFPLDSFEGRVVRVGAQTITAEDEQFFVVRALVPNAEEKIRPGMVGRAKIDASGGWGGSAWYPIGYVLLRDPGRWLLHKLWVWMP